MGVCRQLLLVILLGGVMLIVSCCTETRLFLYVLVPDGRPVAGRDALLMYTGNRVICPVHVLYCYWLSSCVCAV